MRTMRMGEKGGNTHKRTFSVREREREREEGERDRGRDIHIQKVRKRDEDSKGVYER